MHFHCSKLRIILLFLSLVHVTCFLTFLTNDDQFLSSGYFHTCALENRPGVEIGGGIKCWGDNRKGQTSSPPGIHRQISSGNFFSCAISIEEEISCWGEMEGEVPEGRFKQVSVGRSHACALDKNGRVKCWGRNDFGESQAPPHHFAQVSTN